MYTSPETSSSVELDVWITFSSDSKASASPIRSGVSATNASGKIASNPMNCVLFMVSLNV